MAQPGNLRPLSDWLVTQGTTSVFFPPAPDILGVANSDDPPITPLRFGLIDYAGVFAAYLQLQSGGSINLGTSVSGTITEQALADGRARVRVNLHTTNALVWVTDPGPNFSNFPGPALLGNSVADVLLGAAPVLWDCSLEVRFTNTAPGAPLPNLVIAAGNLGPPPPGVEIEHIRFQASAFGPLHAAFGVLEGTAGLFFTSQTGNFETPPMGPTPDSFPVETMIIKVAGGGN
jgi:hypothetical protein